MKIPSDPALRIAFYNSLISQCFASRQTRMDFYSQMRMYYLFGSETGQLPEGSINKIYPTIDLLCSFLYAQETTRFATQFDKSADKLSIQRASSMNEAINDEWFNSNADSIANDAVKWGLVYNTMIVKLVIRGTDIAPYLVNPQNFGVLREDIPSLDRQEACAVMYQQTVTDMDTQLVGHPRRDEIMSQVSATKRQDDGDQNLPISRLLISAGPGTGSSNITGQADQTSAYTFAYAPVVDADMVKMYELYVYDDDLNDYRIVTIANPGVIVFDRPAEKVFLQHELPFIKFTPNPLPDYFWGLAEVDQIKGLQKRRDKLTNMLQHLLDLNAQPPKALMGDGWTGLADEKFLALGEPDSYISIDNPNAKVQEFRPSIPEDLWREFGYNDEQFQEAVGLSNTLQGKGEHGVRSQSHSKSLATMGSSRAKKRALVIEDSLEKMATLYAKLMRRYDDKHYVDDMGQSFVFAQIDDKFLVKVDAHSNSPIFMEDQQQMASQLLQSGSISKKRFLQLMNPPMLQTLINDLAEKIEPAEQQAAEKKEKMELVAIAAKQHDDPNFLDKLMKMFGKGQ